MAIGRESVVGETEGKTLVLRIYQRNGNVITFPVLDRAPRSASAGIGEYDTKSTM